MTPDFEFLEKNYENKQALVTYMFDHYKRLIYKKGILFTRSLRNKVEVDDFVGDVYEKLFFYANYIKLEKVDSEKFMFYIYVHYACCDVYASYIRKNKHTVSLDDENNFIQPAVTQNESFVLQKQEFFNQLTSLQKRILSLREENRTIVEIQKRLNLSYFLVTKNISIIQEKANLYL